jgi:predicted phosphodiesterase
MRIAIFSDVHGNLTALNAVLADIKNQAPDLVIFAGDLCLYGPRPAECVARIQQEKIAAIYGNKDQELSNRPILSTHVEEATRKRQQSIENIVDWTIVQLSEEQRAWLHALPFHRRISPTVDPRDDLFIFHANPKDVEQHIYPPEDKQTAVYGEVKQPDDDPALHYMLRDVVCRTLAFGHVHIPSVRRWQNLVLANISSVSLARDGDRRAKYGLFRWHQDGGWHIEHRYVEYDMEKELALLADIRPPDWESVSRQLETARL